MITRIWAKRTYIICEYANNICVQSLTTLASTVPEIIWLVPTKILMVHVLFRDVFIILELELATVNLPTKLEVFISTNYEDMKGD